MSSIRFVLLFEDCDVANVFYFVCGLNVVCVYLGLFLYSIFFVHYILFEVSDMSPHAVQTRKLAHKKKKIKSGKKVTLHHAANCGDLERLKIMLKKGADIDGVDVSGHTALHILVEYGDLEGVKLLIKEGADVDLPRNDGSTVVHIAAAYGLEQLLKILLDNKAQVNVMTCSGFTPLHLSVLGNHLGCVKLLLRKGAHVNATTSPSGQTPLHIAILNSKMCIDPLIEERADIFTEDSIGVSPLDIASELGLEYMKRLIPRKSRFLSSEGVTPVHIAAQSVNEECLKFFIEEGCDANIPTKTDSPNIDMLVKAGAYVNKKNHKGLAPIHICALLNHLQPLEKLLHYDVDINIRGGEKRSTPLHLAAEKGNFECLVYLIDHGADVNAVDKEKNTPLMLAGRKRSFACIRYLLQNDAFLWVM